MDVSFSTMGAGVMHLTNLTHLPTTLATACPLNPQGTYPSLQHEPDPAAAAAAANKKQPPAAAAAASATSGLAAAATTTSLSAVLRLLDCYPGPLGSNSSKDKCVKFLKERLTHCHVDELGSDAPAWQVDARKALWDLLLLLANNNGQLKASSSGGSSASSKAVAAVGNLLKGAVDAADGAAAAGPGSPVKGVAAAAAAAGGGTSSESELLRILAPGAAAGSTAGARVLAAAVPEMELQATAAEMQVRSSMHSAEHPAE